MARADDGRRAARADASAVPGDAPGNRTERRRARRLVLCDGQRLYAETLAAALRSHGWDVFVATGPADALRLVDLHEPDMCLTGLHFPDVDGSEAVAGLAEREPRRPVLVLSASADAGDRAAAAALGAVGVVGKDQPLTVIFDAVDRIAAGEVPALPAQRPTSRSEGQRTVMAEQLTRRERQVLQRLLEAEDTAQIATSLGVAPSTVRTHLQNVFVKMGVTGRLQAAARAIEWGVVGELPGRLSARLAD